MSESASESKPTVAFIGVGRMGAAMLEYVLRAGYQAVLCDPSAAALAPFLRSYPEQVRVAPDPGAAAREATLIEIVVNTNEQLLEVCLGERGVLAHAAPDSVVLVHSTVSHQVLRQLCGVAAQRKVHLLDAMVSGAMGQYSIPNLAVMCGGDAGAFERAKPVLSTYGSLVLHLGPLGAGLDAKLSINLLRYLCMLASQEATRLAQDTGVGAALAQLVAHTECARFTGDWSQFCDDKKIPAERRVVDAALSAKDLRAAIERAAEVELELPCAERATGLMHTLWGVTATAPRKQGAGA